MRRSDTPTPNPPARKKPERSVPPGSGWLRLVAGNPARGEEAKLMRRQAPADSLEDALARDLDGTFERLVLEYQDRLFGFAFRLCASREDAEEIAQDAFLRSYRALKGYPPDRIRGLALRAWLYQITWNVARNRFRRKRHRFVSLESGGGIETFGRLDPADDPERRPDRRLEKRRERADIATLVLALPERFRAPLVLRYVEGLPVDEVAAVLKQPVGTAKSNLHRAVNALRASLSRSRSVRLRPLEVNR